MSTSENGTSTKRIAALDLGTNSFHVVIVDIYPDGSFRTVDKLKEMVILAEKGMGNRLSDDAMERGLAALKKIKILCESQEVERILAYATSAIREAVNGGVFIQRMIDEVGIKALAISGKIEAELIGHAIKHAVKLGDETVLMVDIGGGSVEFIVANNDKFFYSESKKVGVARMAAQFVDNDPITKDEIKELRKFFANELADIADIVKEHNVKTIVGSSGTMENIAAMIADHNSITASMTLNEVEFDAEEFKGFYKYFIKLDRDARLKEDELEEKRVDIIAPGMILLDYLIKEFGIEQVKISESALREGMILHYIKKEQDKLDLQLVADFPDPRRRSVFELLRKCDWHEQHSTHVTKIALKLFDELQKELNLPDSDRELLEYAGYMHDIGYYISHRKHHKHALYLIRNADLKGFKEDEIDLMANVARYHRRSTPKKRHKRFRKLDKHLKRRVKKLAGILRVADGLDRSHFQNVKKVEINNDDEELTLFITTESDPELEIWGAMRKSHLFEQVTGKTLTIYPKEEGKVLEVEQPDPFPERKS